MQDLHIRPYLSSDWSTVEAIYWQGINSGLATFERQPKSQSAFEKDSVPSSIYVATLPAAGIVGWIALWPISARCCYEGVAEVSIYVSDSAKGRGVGSALLSHIVAFSESHGFWTLEAKVLANNEASVKLHQKCGFRIVGIREKIGHKNKVFQDVTLMERRSVIV